MSGGVSETQENSERASARTGDKRRELLTADLRCHVRPILCRACCHQSIAQGLAHGNNAVRHGLALGTPLGFERRVAENFGNHTRCGNEKRQVRR